MTAPFRFDVDATATPGYRPRPVPTMRAAGPRPAGSNRPSTVMDQFLDAIASAFQPGEDTAGGMLKEMVSPIRAGVQARQAVGEASRAAGQGRVGAALGSAALAAMAVPGVPGDEGVRAAKVADHAADVARPGIRAYHGTPHTFAPEPDAPLGRFRMDKMGTGEGVQAYAHGLYFAEAQDVGRSYRDGPIKATIEDAQRRLAHANGNVDAAIALIRQKIARYRQGGGDGYALALEEPLRELEKFKANGEWSTGSLYEVGIDASPDDLLDWDAPLSQQSDRVREAINRVFVQNKVPHGDAGQLSDYTGSDIYKWLENHIGERGSAARELGSSGIPGIRYLDGVSRDVGQGTRNYVIWDESKLRILRALAAAGMVSGAALAKAEQEFAAQNPEGN